jgi:hypothetical protein
VSPSVWEGAAQAYEVLRCDLLQSSGQNGWGNGRAILLRRGLLAWTRERDNNAILPTPTPPSGSESRVPSEIASELVRLVAGLILSRKKECCYG